MFGRVIQLDAEALGLGTLGLMRVIPIMIFALLGGMLADTQDRRRVLIYTQTISAVLAVILAWVTLTDRVSIAVIYILTSALAATTAMDNPARQSLLPNLVPMEHLSNAVSLNVLQWQIGTIIGPVIATGLVAWRYPCAASL